MHPEAAPREVESPRIAVLPDHVVDQIAAGEVIERPASVVKELVENALDAGARTISVEIEEGGRRLIRVVDDGCGMTPEEARLALRRHATSKLRSLDDLFGLASMGFRGEALPSIAAVARLALTTRPRDDAAALAGFHLSVDAGRLTDATEIGAPVGTQVEVRDLLYNIPARLKFLKGDATETAHINDVVTRLALAHPAVHIRLRNNGRQVVQAPPHRDGFERAQCLLGARLAGRLHRAAGSEGGVDVVAYLAAPELAQTTARGVQLFVGRRSVRDRGLLQALAMGYGELVPRGRYPLAILFVDVPVGAVDVNVHPQKLEVRFADPQRVYAAVRHVVARAVGEAPWLGEPAPAVAPIRMQAIASSSPPSWSAAGRASELAADYARTRERMLLPFSAPAPYERSLPRFTPPRGNAVAPAPERADPEEGGAPATFFTGLRYLGQLDRTYLVCEAAGELVLLDQHAAHERVAFQRLRERHDQQTLPVQRLLFPQPVELSPEQAAMAAEAREELGAVGFELVDRADGAALNAVPAGLRGADPADVLRELCDELVDRGGSRAMDDRLDAVFATIACHSVVRAGDALSPAEAEALLASLDGVDFKAHCPHGRPVLLRISVSEIARRFGRT